MMEEPLPRYTDFRDSLVAFVDVLGMNRLINAIKTEEDFLRVRNLICSIRKIAEQLNSSKEVLSGFRFTGVSDCLIATIPITYEGCAMSLVLLLHQLQYMFLVDFHVMLRGYISRGPVYHENGVLFGSGYSDAYMGERITGGAPRIVLNPSIVESAKAGIERQRFFCTVFDLITEDPSDGFHFIDYLKPANAISVLSRRQSPEDRELIKRLIDEGLEKYRDDYTIRPKFKWLQSYCERCAGYFM
jgi:hypothetical protein